MAAAHHSVFWAIATVNLKASGPVAHTPERPRSRAGKMALVEGEYPPAR